MGYFGGGVTKFESAEQTITSAGLVTIAHGLGEKPTEVFAVFKCKTAESGFSVGDELLETALASHNGTTGNKGLIVYADATNVYVRYASNASTISILNKGTGVAAGLNAANWNLIVRAWL